MGTEIKYIRLGLEKGFDVSIYNKPEFDNKQMHEIYMGLLNDVNVLLYATSKLDWNEMRKIRWELEDKNKNKKA